MTKNTHTRKHSNKHNSKHTHNHKHSHKYSKKHSKSNHRQTRSRDGGMGAIAGIIKKALPSVILFEAVRATKKHRHKKQRGGAVKTRMSKKHAINSYRRRRKLSHCRGKGPAVCRSKPGCKYASGKKRSFCRKSKSHRRSKRH